MRNPDDRPVDDVSSPAWEALIRAEHTAGPVALAAGEHPSGLELLALGKGELDEATARRLRLHVADCGSCARLAASLLAEAAATTDSSAAEAGQPTAERSQAMWHQLSQRLYAHAPPHPQPPEVLPFRGRLAPRSRVSLALAALAAMLLIAVSLLTWRVQELGSTVEELRLAQGSSAHRSSAHRRVAVLDDFGAGLLRGGESTLPTLELPPGTTDVLLLLPLPVLASSGPQDVLLLRDDGREVFSAEGLIPTQMGTLALLVRREQLTAGTYEARVTPQAAPSGAEPTLLRFRLLDGEAMER